jgi:nicotinamidase-related amidase
MSLSITTKSRGNFLGLAGATVIGTAVAAGAPSQIEAAGTAVVTDNPSEVPELHPQWRSLDLASILALPTAFVSISQSNSLYDPNGAQSSERHWDRPSLSNTIKVAKAARAANAHFFWVGYDIFREHYPKTPFDRVQYATWYGPYEHWSAARKKWDGELTPALATLRQPGDVEFFETAHQTSFVGTPLPGYLSKLGIHTIILTGIHLDWCIEGNTRAARDNGIMPIVVADACACQKPEDEAAALRRINTFFAPVVSTDAIVALLDKSRTLRSSVSYAGDV